MKQGDSFYIIDAVEKQWLANNGFADLANKFSVDVTYNGSSYYGCSTDDVDFFDYDFEFISEGVSFETVYYYKSGMFFDRP